MLSRSRIAARKIPALMLAVLFILFGMALPGCSRGGGPLDDGLYLRTTLSNAGFLWVYMIYISGDRIVWNAWDGVDPIDFDAAEKTNATNVGRFKINGDKMDVVWGGGRGAQSLRLEFKNGKVSSIDYGGIIKADPYAKDARLDTAFGGNIGPVIDGTSVKSNATLSFAKDGKFTLIGEGSAASKVNQQGTYQLSGNTLTLHFSDGRTERHTVIPFDSNLDPAHRKLSDERLMYEGSSLPRVR